MGLGWSITSTPTSAAAIVALVQVPWDQANQHHEFVIVLLDADGREVQVGLHANGNAEVVRIHGAFEVGRPPGLPPGTPIDQAITVNLAAGLPLAPGTYQYRLKIDGEDIASRSFLAVLG